jgi:hypothetical protein
MAELHALKEPPSEGEFMESYAVEKSVDPQAGKVYEICWVRGRSGWSQTLMPIYVWRDAAGRWRLIGEGPEDTWDRGWYSRHHGTSHETTIQWKGSPPLPVITVVQTDWLSGCTDRDGSGSEIELPGLEVCRDAVLDAGKPLPATIEWSSQQYVAAEKDDTLEKIVRRLAIWGRGGGDWQGEEMKPNAELSKKRQAIERALLKTIEQLNPRLPKASTAVIPQSTRVIIPAH